MIQVIVRPVRYQLGAEELVELGRGPGQAFLGRTPFLASRYELGRRSMGDLTADVQGYVTGALALNLETLAALLGVSYDSLLQGRNVTFTDLGTLLDNAPVLTGFLSQTLLLGNTAMRYGLPMPVSLANGLSGVLGNVSQALSARSGVADIKWDMDEARNVIVGQAPESLRDGVKAMLDSASVSV